MRRAALVDPVEPDEHAQPADRAGHADDRRPVEVRRLEPARVRPPRGGPVRVDRLEREVPAERRRRGDRARRVPRRRRPCPPDRAATSGPGSRRRRRRSPRGRPGSRPALCAPSTTRIAPRAWAISAMPAIGRTAPVAHSTCEIATSRVSARRWPRRRRRGRASGSRAGADVDEDELDAEPIAQVVAGRPMPPGCSRLVVTARSPGLPVDRPDRRCSCRRSWRGSARCRPTSAVSTAATAARASAIRWSSLVEVVGVARARSSARRSRARPSRRPSRRAAARPSPVFR